MPTWTRVVTSAAFPGRDSARAFRMGGRQFISNGYVYGGALLRDLWSTTNATTWTQVNSSTPYDGYSAMAAIGDVLYAVEITMWKSLDGGVTWTQILTDLGLSPNLNYVTADAPLLVVNGVMTLINQDAVYTYDEAANAWTKIGTPPGGGLRSIPSAAVFNGSIYLVGGCDETNPNVPSEGGYNYKTFNDVWKSDDGGASWEQIVFDLPYQPRMWPTIQVFENKMFIMGGWDNVQGGRNFTDTYYTEDGKVWSRLICTAEFSERHAPFSYVFNGQLYIAAGNANPNGTTMNDIWRLTL